MSSVGFEDPKVAQQTRDVLTKLMIKTLDQERPPYEYGTVQSITPELGKCSVLIPPDTVPVDIKFGAMRPMFVGQVVRISGNLGDRFISDVIGGAVTADAPASSLVAPTGLDLASDLGGVWAYWNAVIGAVKYELQIADNNLFTINNRTFQTFNTQFTLGNLTPGATYYARVRALTSNGQTGPWSAVDSATAGAVTYQPSDGVAPSASPQPVITAGLGFLLAEWLPTSNNDPVTYEVHISTTSGFTPLGTTKIGETNGTFYFIRRMGPAHGYATLAYGTTYYVRLVAKDKDGSAAVGAQGSGSPIQVNTGDVGRINTSEIGDGVAPSSSPSLASGITNGIGYLYAKWDHIVNADAVTYEVHVSTASGFTPNSNTLVGTTPSNFFFIRKQGPGGSPANGTLVYGTTYYVRLIAKDIDGQAAVGAQGSGTPLQTLTTDIGPNQITTGLIAVGAITAASAIIADAAIATAKIQDAAISTAKIADLAVSSAKIDNLAVGTAQIKDLAVNTAKIANLAVTDAKIDTLSATKIVAGTIGAHTIVVSASGIMQSSNYVAGSAGWQIKGDGTVEFASGTFRGAIVGATVTGGTVRTAASGKRVQMDTSNVLSFFTGDSLETIPGTIESMASSGGGVSIGSLILSAPVMSSQFPATNITMYGKYSNGTGGQINVISAGNIGLDAQTSIGLVASTFITVTSYSGGITLSSSGAGITLDGVSISSGGYLTASYGTRIGELYGHGGLYRASGQLRLDSGNTSVALSVGGGVKFESGAYNYLRVESSMEQNSLFLKNAGDYEQRVYFHSGFNGVFLHGWESANLKSGLYDIMAMAGAYAAYLRVVNHANTAWRDVGAANTAGYSDPRAKQAMKSTGRGEALAAIRKAKPFRFKWKDGWGDNFNPTPDVVEKAKALKMAAPKGNPGKTWMGLSALEVPEDMRYPMATVDEPDGQGINLVSGIAYLWGAVQDLDAEHAEVKSNLELRLDELTKEVQELRARVPGPPS